MTPKRIEALQWFYDRGEVQKIWDIHPLDRPSAKMIRLMLDDGQVGCFGYRELSRKTLTHHITDKGRRDLHEATR